MIKTIDPRFVGKWRGSDDGKLIEEQVNFCIMNRNANGTFEIVFETHYQDGSTKQSFENGNWYVIDDVFYEYRESDNQTDVYLFEFLSPKIIQFIDINSKNLTPYMFKDYIIIYN